MLVQRKRNHKINCLQFDRSLLILNSPHSIQPAESSIVYKTWIRTPNLEIIKNINPNIVKPYFQNIHREIIPIINSNINLNIFELRINILTYY